MDQAWWRLLALDGHAQGGDGGFRPRVIARCPTNILPGKTIEYDRQICSSANDLRQFGL
jgi:hypothetical protein